MNEFFDSVGAVFLKMGVHPVLGSFLAGFIFFWLIRRKKSDTVVVSPSLGTMPSASSFISSALKNASNISKSSISIEASTLSPSASASFNINGQQIPVRPEDMAKVIELLKSDKISAIKLLRGLASLDLKDAKDIVDALSKIHGV